MIPLPFSFEQPTNSMVVVTAAVIVFMQLYRFISLICLSVGSKKLFWFYPKVLPTGQKEAVVLRRCWVGFQLFFVGVDGPRGDGDAGDGDLFANRSTQLNGVGV